jgi:hypothetical protein
VNSSPLLDRLMSMTVAAVGACLVAPAVAAAMQEAVPALIGLLVLLAMVRLAIRPKR